jgi:cyclopropane fatty-acyl-phospholipid synthase-like methyltransferase
MHDPDDPIQEQDLKLNKALKNKQAPQSMAEKADRHLLYQDSVQCVEAEIDFIDDTFKQLRKRRARTLREDFCGTGNTSCEWVRRRKSNTALGVDLDQEVLAWGGKHNRKALGKSASRLTLLKADVMEVQSDPSDVIVAMNFSYWLLKERHQLRQYFSRVRDALVSDGIFFLDLYGGYDSGKEVKEKTKHDGFTYIWHQAHINPVNADMRCHIHFKFPDGSKLRKAFSYSWRLWTLPEIRELLDEAGFRKVTVYWQGWDDELDEASGDFTPATEGDADPSWICYLTAEK